MLCFIVYGAVSEWGKKKLLSVYPRACESGELARVVNTLHGFRRTIIYIGAVSEWSNVPLC